jgi:hypothetical protein
VFTDPDIQRVIDWAQDLVIILNQPIIGFTQGAWHLEAKRLDNLWEKLVGPLFEVYFLQVASISLAFGISQFYFRHQVNFVLQIYAVLQFSYVVMIDGIFENVFIPLFRDSMLDCDS